MKRTLSHEMNETLVHETAAALYAAAAGHITAAAARAVAERGRFLLVLAGGTTPRGVYEQLASRHADRLDWQRVRLFWGDERCVPPDHPESNYGMAAAALLEHVPIPPGNLHRIHGEEPAERAAARYDAELAEFFRAATPEELGDKPAFDLVLLGIGADGHTASLFPRSPALEATGWAVAARAPDSAAAAERVTLTLPAINASRECLLLVTGAAKRQVAQQVLRPPSGSGHGDSVLPAALVRPRRRSFWFFDAAAAGSAVP